MKSLRNPKKQKASKPVFEYNLDGTFSRSYSSITEASVILSGGKSVWLRSLRNCLAGKQKSFHGKMYSFEKKESTNPYIDKEKKEYYKYSLSGKFLKKYNNIDEIIEDFPKLENWKKLSHLYGACCGTRKSFAGFMWRHEYFEEITPYRDIRKPINIYYYKSKLTGELYIGQTVKTLARRAGKNGKNYKESKKFYSAILKYGWNNFERGILAVCKNQEEADFLENQLINKYETFTRGYNSNYGGQQIVGRKLNKNEVITTIEIH